MRVLLFAAMLCPILAYAQNGQYTLGARQRSLGGAGSPFTDAFAIFNNVGAMGFLDQSTVAVASENRFGIKELFAGGAAISHHTRHFNAGFKYYRYGGAPFNIQLAGMAIANHFQMVGLGIGINIIQSHVEGLPNAYKIALEMGGSVRLTDDITLAAHLFNIQHEPDHPMVMKVGLLLQAHKNLALLSEAEKILEQGDTYKTALEYIPVQHLSLRTGIALVPYDEGSTQIGATFGLGWCIRHFDVDYAYTTQPVGAVHHLSMSLRLSQ